MNEGELTEPAADSPLLPFQSGEAEGVETPGPSAGRRGGRARRDELRATSASVAIAFSLFLILLMAALLVGGHAIIDPLLYSAAALREANRVGQVIYTMPDGVFCRRLSFDNATAEMNEGAVGQCPTDSRNDHSHARLGFAWGGH